MLVKNSRMSSGVEKPTVSGRLIVVAPASMTASHHTAEEVDVAARGVLRRKLHVVGVLASEAHGIDRSLQTLLPAHPELRLQVQIGRRDERVNAAPAQQGQSTTPLFPGRRDGTGPGTR